MIRFAAKPNDLQGARCGPRRSNMGFEIAFRVMYFSDWWSNQETLSTLVDLGQNMDVVYLVDSYGATTTGNNSCLDIGGKQGESWIHGHNNLESRWQTP